MKIFKHPLLGLLLGIALAGGLVGATTYYNQFGPANGILVGVTTSPATTAATSSNVTALWSGTCNASSFLRGDGACAAPTVPTGANPSATLGLSAINGVASTFMRSDAAPPLSQAIVPTWTGKHTFTQTGIGNIPISINESSAGNGLFINATDNTTTDNFSINLNGDSGFMLLAGANSANGGNCVTNGAIAPYWCLAGTGVIPFSFGTNGIERLQIDGNGRFIFNAPSVTGSSAFTFNGINGNNIALFRTGAGSGTAFGVVIQAGTTSADRALDVQSQGGGSVYFRVAGNGAITGFSATQSAAVDMSPDRGSTTVTGTGFSANPTATMNWARVGNLVCASVPQLTGTSNSASFTITDSPSLPASALPAIAGAIMVFGADNTTATPLVIIVNTSNSPLFTLGKNTAAGGGFTTSGTKTLTATKVCWTTN